MWSVGKPHTAFCSPTMIDVAASGHLSQSVAVASARHGTKTRVRRKCTCSFTESAGCCDLPNIITFLLRFAYGTLYSDSGHRDQLVD